MDENLKDIDATIDNFTTYLKLFENNKYTNSELVYFSYKCFMFIK